MRFDKQVFSNFDNRHTRRPIPLNLIVNSLCPDQDNSLLRVRLLETLKLVPDLDAFGRTKMCRYDVIQENKDVLCLFSPNS